MRVHTLGSGGRSFGPKAASTARSTGASLARRSCRLRPLSRGSRPRTGRGSTTKAVSILAGRFHSPGSSGLRLRCRSSVATRLPGPDHTGWVLSWSIRGGRGRKGAALWPAAVAWERAVDPPRSRSFTGAAPRGAPTTASQRVESRRSGLPANTW